MSTTYQENDEEMYEENYVDTGGEMYEENDEEEYEFQPPSFLHPKQFLNDLSSVEMSKLLKLIEKNPESFKKWQKSPYYLNKKQLKRKSVYSHNSENEDMKKEIVSKKCKTDPEEISWTRYENKEKNTYWEYRLIDNSFVVREGTYKLSEQDIYSDDGKYFHEHIESKLKEGYQLV